MNRTEGLSMNPSDDEEEAEGRVDAHLREEERRAAIDAFEKAKSPELRSMENRIKEIAAFANEEIDRIFSTETSPSIIKKKIKEVIQLFKSS